MSAAALIRQKLSSHKDGPIAGVSVFVASLIFGLFVLLL